MKEAVNFTSPPEHEGPRREGYLKEGVFLVEGASRSALYDRVIVKFWHQLSASI